MVTTATDAPNEPPSHTGNGLAIEPRRPDLAWVMKRLYVQLSGPDAWTKGAEARGADGHRCRPTSAKACSWCLTGGIDYVVDEIRDLEHAARLASEAEDLLYNILVGQDAPDLISVTSWNDDATTTHKMVYDLLWEAYWKALKAQSSSTEAPGSSVSRNA